MASTRRSIQRERFERKIETNGYEQTETESSFLKALEQEDMQRFNAEVQREPEKRKEELATSRNLENRNIHEGVVDSIKIPSRSKRPNLIRPEDNKHAERRKSERKTKDVISPRSRGHRNRFVQSRNLKSAKDQTMKRWHSDSDLLTTSKDGRSLTAKVREGKDRKHAQDKEERAGVEIRGRRRQAREKAAIEATIEKEGNRPRIEKGRREESNETSKELWRESTEKGRLEKSNRAPKDIFKESIAEPMFHGKKEREESEDLKRSKGMGDVTVLNASFPSSINGEASSRIARAKDSHRRRHTSAAKSSSGELNEFERGKGYENRLINLLMEYFKDLNQEVREFREEKKQMQQQIRSMDSKIDKLAMQQAVHEATTKKRDVESRYEGDCVDSMARPDFRQEIRNILADVHSKYHQQLMEHEMRMKSVQEKAEQDIQKLMKNIVGKYVELTQLKGRFADIDKLTRGTTGIHHRDDVVYKDSLDLDNRIKQKAGVGLQSRAAKTKNNSEAGENVSPQFQVNAKQDGEKSEGMKKITSNDIWSRYEFYFPRKDRPVSKSEETVSVSSKNSKAPEMKSKQNLKLVEIDSKDCPGKEIRPISAEQTETSSASDSGIDGGKQMNIPKAKVVPPPGLGSSYFEWKQFWCDKLQQRRTEAEQKTDGKACTENLKTKEQCRNTV